LKSPRNATGIDMTNLHRSPPMNQSKTDLGIVNESQLLRFGITDTRADHERRARMHATEILTDAQLKAKARGVRCAMRCGAARERFPVRSDHQYSRQEWVRLDCDGITWPTRRCRHRLGK
jgi:hypothetical protein